jgi:hypothetical protein
MFSPSLRWMRSACATAGCSASLADGAPNPLASSALTKPLFRMRIMVVYEPESSILIARIAQQTAYV